MLRVAELRCIWLIGLIVTTSGQGLAGQPVQVTTAALQPQRSATLVVDTLWRVGGDEDLGGVSFGGIGGVATDAAGRIFVADFRLQVIHVLNQSGRVLRTIGRAGDGPGEFRLPMRVAVAPDGHLFVYDAYQGRLSEYDTEHRFVRSHILTPRLSVRTMLATSTSVTFSGIDPNPAGSDAVLHEYSREHGTLIRSFGRIHVVRSPDLARRAPAGPVAPGPDGSWWYASPGPYRIEQYSAAGELLLRTERPNDFLGPAEEGIGVHSQGNRVTFSNRPRAVVSRLSLMPDGSLWHQVTLESGEVVTDRFEITRRGAQSVPRLAQSWVGRFPVLSNSLGAGEFLVQSAEPATGAAGLMRVRIRGTTPPG